MRHLNKVKQLGRTRAHRKSMMANMVTSLFDEERIVTTKQKGKELKKISERLITRAKNNLEIPIEETGKILHNKRIVMKLLKNRDIVKKLFEDIAVRFKERKGGYTRLYLTGRRQGDAAEMAIVELVVMNKAKSESTEKSSDKKKTVDKKKGGEKKSEKSKKDKKE